MLLAVELDDPDLPAEVRAALSNRYCGPSSCRLEPRTHLLSHVPISIATNDMVPRYQTVTSRSGQISTARSFGTRKPTTNTGLMFDYFKTAPEMELVGDGMDGTIGRLIIRSDHNAITMKLSRRLREYLSTNPVDTAFEHRSIARSTLNVHDSLTSEGRNEVGLQGKAWLWDGSYVNDFIKEGSMFKDGQPLASSVQPATQWGAGAAIGDLMLVDSLGECQASWEEKPKFDHRRMQEVHRHAQVLNLMAGNDFEGFYLERHPGGVYTCSLDSQDTESPVVKSEQYVYIQVSLL